MAHAGEEIALGAGRRLRLPLGLAQLIDQFGQLLGVPPLRAVSLFEIAGVIGQCRFGAPALGDVAHVAREHRRSVGGNRRDDDLDRKRLSSLADGRQLETLVQQHRVAGIEIPRQTGPVRLGFAGGNNQFGQLDADRLGRAVAEGPLRGRIELYDAAALVHHDDAVQRDVQNGIVASPGVSRIGLRELACPNLLFERRRTVRRIAHLQDASTAGDEQEYVFEDDPCGVLDPAPLTRHQDAVNRLRPQGPTQHVIQGDDDGGRDENFPVAIEGQKGERAKDVKVGFDASAGEVDEQRAHQHLGDGDRVTRRRLAGPKPPQESGEQADRAADDDGRPDMEMRAADRTGPGKRRHPQREHDPGDPLEPHQTGEQPVGALVDVLLVRGEELAGSTPDRLRRCNRCIVKGHDRRSLLNGVRCRMQTVDSRKRSCARDPAGRH